MGDSFHHDFWRMLADNPVLQVIGWVLLWLVPTCAAIYLLYYLVSLPLRRQERARFFLDLLETGMKCGRSIEQSIVAASQSGDRALGVRFHLLAAYLEAGRPLREALEEVPRFLPPRITAMLGVGLETGNLLKVLPACRRLLRDGVSQTRGALNYLLLLVFGITPMAPLLYFSIKIHLLPRFQEILLDLETPVPPLTAWLFETGSALFLVEALLVGLVGLLALCYVGGPRLQGWLAPWFSPLVDRLALRLPWRRRRLQRDFSTMLALLLDAGVPEAQAVLLAAESTANQTFQGRAVSVASQLDKGVSLPQAVAQLDHSGEFRWRLANASHGQGGFLAALNGWLEALDAKAFQEEQFAAQTLTTVLVLVNGAIVGMLVTGMFQMLVAIVQEGVLW